MGAATDATCALRARKSAVMSSAKSGGCHEQTRKIAELAGQPRRREQEPCALQHVVELSSKTASATQYAGVEKARGKRSKLAGMRGSFISATEPYRSSALWASSATSKSAFSSPRQSW